MMGVQRKDMNAARSADSVVLLPPGTTKAIVVS